LTPYRAPAWLPGGHAQTIWPVLRKPAPPPYRRERWETPDGDFIDVDWLAMQRRQQMRRWWCSSTASRAALPATTPPP
jgi:predicted alpha/beta-fold hydrolase